MGWRRPKVFNQYKAMLDAIGDRAAYVGPIDSATVAKLVHNMSATRLSARSPKPSTLGVKAGMDPFTLWQAVRLDAITFHRRGGNCFSCGPSI